MSPPESVSEAVFEPAARAAVPTQPVVLLTLGRLPVALETARAFHAAGWQVIVAEPLPWHLCRLSRAIAQSFTVTSPIKDARRYRRDLLEIIRDQAVSLVVPVSEEILFVSRLREELAHDVTLLSADFDTLLQLHDKWRFNELARSLDLPVPASALGDSDEALQLIRAGDYVLKPRLSCSGQGVVRATCGALPDVEQRRDDTIVQARLTESGCSTFTVAVAGQCRVLVSYRSLLESGSVAVCFETIDTPPAVERFIATVVRSLDFTGMISFDFLQDHAGAWQAIECNPRATSGIHFVPPDELHGALSAAAQELSVMATGQRMTHDATDAVMRIPGGRRRQEFWSSLTELERRLFGARWNRHDWRRLFGTRDISWAMHDKKPALLMPFASRQLLWRAVQQRRPVAEVAMQDVGWYADVDIDSTINLQLGMSPLAPDGVDALLGTTIFGSDGLRYRRLAAAAQQTRFAEPMYVAAHVNGHLAGVYVLDKRRLLVNGVAHTGFYRGVLAVDVHWQGQGVGRAMTRYAMDWIDQQAASSTRPILSYGCIDISNVRSVNLLTSHEAKTIRPLSLYLMYRQWLRNRCELVPLSDETAPAFDQLLAQCQAECVLRDVTPSALPGLVLLDERGIRIGARVTLSAFEIVSMGALAHTMTRLFVTPWAVARRRFDPACFRHVVFSHVAIRPGCERDWPRFVSSVLAQHGVHFGVVYPDPATGLFARLRLLDPLSALVHSSNGSIQVMVRTAGSPTGPVTDLSASTSHALYPVDA